MSRITSLLVGVTTPCLTCGADISMVMRVPAERGEGGLLRLTGDPVMPPGGLPNTCDNCADRAGPPDSTDPIQRAFARQRIRDIRVTEESSDG